jgi:Leucine-rich repeat (LRR) protein
MGHLNRIFQNLRILSLEDNLISDWHQVYQLGYELPQLNELSLSNNHIHPAITSFSEL